MQDSDSTKKHVSILEFFQIFYNRVHANDCVRRKDKFVLLRFPRIHGIEVHAEHKWNNLILQQKSNVLKLVAIYSKPLYDKTNHLDQD